jgi:AP-3 complex subunit beta
VADTVAAIALCAEKFPSVTSTCLEGLLALVFYGKFALSLSLSLHVQWLIILLGE